MEFALKVMQASEKEVAHLQAEPFQFVECDLDYDSESVRRVGSQLLQSIYDLLRGEEQQGSFLKTTLRLANSSSPKEQELAAYLLQVFAEDFVLDDLPSYGQMLLTILSWLNSD